MIIIILSNILFFFAGYKFATIRFRKKVEDAQKFGSIANLLISQVMDDGLYNARHTGGIQ